MTLVESITSYSAAAAACPAEAIDVDAFQSIYDATARPLWAYLLRVSGRRDIADDLLQETYCRFLARKGAATARPTMSDAETRSYLFRIATNLLRDRWRRRENVCQSGGAFEDGFSEEQAADVPDTAHDPITRIDIRRLMQSLKPRARQLLWLAYVEGMSHAEIAEATGLNSLSIRLLLFRARRQAAALLEPSCAPDSLETR